MTLRDSNLSDKRLYCRIDYDNASNMTDISFTHLKRFFLLSAGNDTKERVEFKRASFVQLSLSEHRSFTKPSRVLMQLHGSLMIIAWLGCCALSTLFPMHYRRCFRTWSLFRKDVWFAVSWFGGVTMGWYFDGFILLDDQGNFDGFTMCDGVTMSLNKSNTLSLQWLFN